MKVEFSKHISGKYTVAYNHKVFGFEFIYLVKANGEKIMLFENRLAIIGFWMNDFQIASMVSMMHFPLKKGGTSLIEVGDVIEVESYKDRGSAPGKPYYYEADGSLRWSPDCVRGMRIV